LRDFSFPASTIHKSPYQVELYSTTLTTPWIFASYVKNSTFGSSSANPQRKSLMPQETQTGTSLMRTIIVRRCQISTNITRALSHSKDLQIKVVNCVVCFGVPG
jgi:hypothetical protein